MKSLFKFGKTSGYLHFNIAAPIPSPKVQNDKAERLLSEHYVFKLIEAAGDAVTEMSMVLGGGTYSARSS